MNAKESELQDRGLCWSVGSSSPVDWGIELSCFSRTTLICILIDYKLQNWQVSKQVIMSKEITSGVIHTLHNVTLT